MLTETCCVCGTDSNLETHHVVPRSMFKSDTDYNIEKNLLTVCRRCHGLLHGEYKGTKWELNTAALSKRSRDKQKQSAIDNGVKYSHACPRWLSFDKSINEYVLNDSAEMVRSMVSDRLSGMSYNELQYKYDIANTQVVKMLRQPALYGARQTTEYGEKTALIHDYYPAIVTFDEFSVLTGDIRNRGKRYFADLLKCDKCSDSFKYQNSSGYGYLKCSCRMLRVGMYDDLVSFEMSLASKFEDLSQYIDAPVIFHNAVQHVVKDITVFDDLSTEINYS